MEDNKVIQFNKDFRKKQKAEGSSQRGYSLYNEGVCFYNKDNDAIALKKFLQAEKEGYKSADMFAYLAYIYYSVEENANIAEYYAKKAIKLDKEYGYPYRLLALFYDDNKDLENALKYNLLAEKYEYNTNPAMMRHISELYTKVGKRNMLKALEYATKAIKLDSKNSFNWYFKGWIYYSDSDYENAVKFFKKAEEKGCTADEFYFEFSYAYGELGNHKKAVEYANKYIFINKDSYSGYYRKGYAYWLWEKLDKALENFLIAEKKECDCADMYCRMAYIYSEKKEFDTAISYTNKALKFNKKEPDAYYTKALISFVEEYDCRSALKYLNKAKKLYEAIGDHFNIEAYCYMITLLGMLGKRKKSLEVCEQALQFYPDSPWFKIMKAFALQSVKKYQQADEIIKGFDVDKETDMFILTYLVAVYYNKRPKERDYDTVLKISERLTGEEAQDMKDVQAFCYYEKGEYEKSLQLMYEYSQNIDVRMFKAQSQGEFKKFYRRLIKKFGQNEKRLKFISEKFGDLSKPNKK